MLKIYLILTGGLLCAAAASLAVARLRNQRRRIVTPGRVVDWIERADGDSPPTTYHHAVVAFYDRDGVEQRFVSRVGYHRPQSPIAATCLVEYDPVAPEHAIEATFAARWGFVVVLAGLGATAVAFGFVA